MALPCATGVQHGNRQQHHRVASLEADMHALHAEMTAILHALAADNMGGIAGPLVDANGFPRADIDVRQTCQLRHRLACLNMTHAARSGLIRPSPKASGRL